MSKTNYLQTFISDLQRTAGPYRCATNRLMHCSKSDCYSIVSSARASSAGGRVRLSAFAVFRLIRSWNLVA
jgi:hypothetical protein